MAKVITIILTSISILCAGSFFRLAHGQESLPETVQRLEREIQSLRNEFGELKKRTDPASSGNNTKIDEAESLVASIFVLPAVLSDEFDQSIRAGCEMRSLSVMIADKKSFFRQDEVEEMEIVTNKITPYVISVRLDCARPLEGFYCRGNQVTVFREEEIYFIDLVPSATGCVARLTLRE